MFMQSFYPIANIWVYVLVIAALEAQAVYTWQFRKMPGAKMAVYSQVCKGILLSSLVLASINTVLPDKLFWITVQKITTLLLPYLWFLFTLQISQQQKLIPSVIMHCINGILGCLLLVILFNWNGLMWQHAWLGGQTVWLVTGPGQWAAMAYGHLLGIITTVLAVRWIVITAGMRRKQASWYLLAVIISWVGHFIWRFSGGSIEAIPWGFLLNGAIVTWLYYRWHLYNILPLAQKVAVQNMIDGLVVVDEYGYIADMNSAAKTIFTGLQASVDVKFEELAKAWPALAEIGGNSGQESMEVTREHPEGTRYYLLTVTSLQTGAYWLGKVIVLKDITRQKKDQEKLLETEKSLSILSERDRLGRELHDGQGQIWNYLKMELNTVRALLNSGQIESAGKQVDWLIGTVKELNTDARESIVGLKNPIDISDDFFTYLEDYLEWYEKNNGIATRLILPAEPVKDLLNQIKFVQLLRIIQEALTNIRKHAKAKQVKVIFQKADNLLRILVEDDGCGFDTADIRESKKNFGLQIMAERAAEEGGRLWIESKPGAGTKVMVEFSLNKTESKEGHHENAIGG